MSVLNRVEAALDRMEADGRKPALLLIGNLEAAELEVEFLRCPWEDDAPLFPLDMGPAQLFNVPIKRVDQDTLIGVVAEGYE